MKHHHHFTEISPLLFKGGEENVKKATDILEEVFNSSSKEEFEGFFRSVYVNGVYHVGISRWLTEGGYRAIDFYRDVANKYNVSDKLKKLIG